MKLHLKNTIYLCLTALCVAVFTSCEEKEDFPDEPVITSIEYLPNTEELVVVFTDGDGNFGLGPDETAPPYQPFLDEEETEPNPYHYNYWLDYYIKTEGEWILVETPGNSDFRIPVLTPTGQNKQLEVTITNDLSLEMPLPPLIVEGDTVKLAVTLVDRALNESNVAETEPFVAPEGN